jgi:hypothetical protein
VKPMPQASYSRPVFSARGENCVEILLWLLAKLFDSNPTLDRLHFGSALNLEMFRRNGSFP